MRANLAIVFVLAIMAFSLLTIIPCPSTAQATTIPCHIGPFLDKNHLPLQNAMVTISYGSAAYNTTTVANGTATISVPREWVNQTISVKFEKAGYKETLFTGSFNNTGKFVPTDGVLSTIEAKETTPTVDYTFLVIALIVFIILIIVLVGMKEPKKTKQPMKKVKAVSGEEE